ncbi:hypothetical protein SCLCIDRAFT_126075 [Scleroderma citrinum Foug A]|uniref:Uncharacterized protein n=1 Tax=Scleroderma citrinum Foug A TaxID=1036808 RepID=A0A0C2ZCC4_9AGAM|nr:hypothetical protein SCLCIDRAFT_126075 [Scleroderma citrinum Foug A]
MFCDYVATLCDPWELTGAVEFVQVLWNIYFSDIDHTVKPKNDLVFFIVSSSFIYVWHSGFASRAEKVVEAYFNQHPCFDDPEQRTAYVKWVVHEPTEKFDKSRWKFLVPPSECPYIWANFDDNDPDHVVCISSFREHLCT